MRPSKLKDERSTSEEANEEERDSGRARDVKDGFLYFSMNCHDINIIRHFSNLHKILSFPRVTRGLRVTNIHYIDAPLFDSGGQGYVKMNPKSVPRDVNCKKEVLRNLLNTKSCLFSHSLAFLLIETLLLANRI